MGKLEMWFLKRLVDKVVVQGGHQRRIVAFYRILICAAREEFTEDNKYTLDGFLSECHQQALDKI